MPLNKSVDAILQRMITDALNLNPTMNITVGSETYIRFSVAASAIYGLYKQADWTVNQIFPSSMSRGSLEQYAADRGINSENMTPAELLSFIISEIRNPKSGGKPSDFERWALSTVSTGASFPLSASSISGTMTDLNAANLLKVHDLETIGCSCIIDDTVKNLIIDLGSSQEITGLGLGVTTNRNASFTISSSDDSLVWTEITSIDVKYWWQVKTFDAISCRYIKLQLESMDELTEEWQTEALNSVKIYGLEVYIPSETGEQATSASCLPNHYGVGTVLIRLLPASLSAKFCEAVRAKCLYEGPVAPREIYASVPTETVISIRVSLTGTLNSTSLFNADIERYFASLDAGDLFIPAQIIVFAIKNGATNASIEVSINGGAYAAQTEALNSGAMERFVLDEVLIE